MEEFVCKITNIVFSNKQSDFFILKALLDNKSDPITIRGTFPGVRLEVGLKIRVKGVFEFNPTWGKQFNASLCEIIPELGKTGIIKYLTSNVKSIGPITATKLYDAFGDDLLNVLDNNPEKIKELSFLTKLQSASILEEWSSASLSRTSSIFLSDMGLNASQVKSVLNVFGVGVKQTLEKNPYALFKCPGVGFSTADQVARRLGVGIDDPKRLRAFIIFLIEDLSLSEGHIYVTSGQILKHAEKAFRYHNIDPFSHGNYILESSFYSEIINLKNSGEIVVDGQNLYTPKNWKHEYEVSVHLSNVVKNGGVEFDLDSAIEEFESQRNIKLSEDQKFALSLLKRSRLCVVSGYPGTGKTTLVSAFVHIFERMGLNCTLLSPTGIAAKRLSQVTGKAAHTIHRALGCDRDGQWEFNSANKYSTDAVIVDEMSMVDSSIFYQLISALYPNTIIVLVGDVAQLPSVGAGYVLYELMHCKHVPHVSLTKIYRQDGHSDIVEVAHAILNEKTVDTNFRKDSEFLFIPTKADEVIQEISKLTSLMKEKSNLTFQVIAPVYDGELGVNNLNKNLREILNPNFSRKNCSKIKHGDTDMYEGDRIMVIKNNYDKMIFNGDTGKIQRISIKNDEVEVKIFNWFDSESKIPRYIDKTFIFKIEEARSILKVAYACTTHRYQGNEIDYVIMPMTMKYGIMLYKNLIYTAITRAKKKVFIFGDPQAFQFAIKNNRETIRNSNLSKLIQV